jgi:hypothetical protein
MTRLFAVDPGFDTTHLLTMQGQTSGSRFDTDAARIRFFAAALERVRQLPGVVSAGFTTQLPFSGDGDTYGVELQGESAAQQTPALRYAVTPGYIETMRIPLLRGRLINERDIAGAPPAVLISQALADFKFPHQNPIGQFMRAGPDAGNATRPWATVVGVLGDVNKPPSPSEANKPSTYRRPSGSGLTLPKPSSSAPATIPPASYPTPAKRSGRSTKTNPSSRSPPWTPWSPPPKSSATSS